MEPSTRRRRIWNAIRGPSGQFGVVAIGHTHRSSEASSSSRLSRTDMSSSRRGGLRSGTNRPKGRTKEQLYNEARKLGIEGRSKMNKAQLQRAVDRRK